MSDETVSNGRASIASVDARVARLEDAQAKTDGTLVLVQAEQTHLRELISARFQTIENSLAAQGSKLDQFVTRIEAMILDATKQAGDLTASPVGRQVHDRITKLEMTVERHDTFVDRWHGTSTALKWAIGSSLTGLLTTIGTLLALVNGAFK